MSSSVWCSSGRRLRSASSVGGFGTLDANSGGAVALVYVVVTIVMSFTAVSYMRLSREIPRVETVFAYASAGIGPRAGFTAGWMILLDYLFIPSVAYLFTGIALNSVFPSVPVWLFTGIAVILTTGLNLAGVKIASRVITLVVVIEVLVLGLVLVLGIIFLAANGPSRDWLSPLTGVGAFSITAVLAAVPVAVLSYLGFDSLATFGRGGQGRAEDRRTRHLGVPCSGRRLLRDADLGGQSALAKAVGAAFSAMIGQAAGSRILMDMSRNGQVPKFLGQLSPRTGVPWKGILVAAVSNVIVAGWATTRADGLDQLTSIVNVGVLSAFIFVQASVVGYFLVKRRGEETPSRLRHGLIPVVGAGLLIIVLVSANPSALVIGAVWLAIGVVVYLVRNRRRV